jgi:uncharacterized protein involved in exopolysaccharide biosynthesis
MTFWKTENSNFETTNILLFLHKWRRLLFFVIIVAVSAAAIFSSPFFITPKFKSTVILYPAATNAVSKTLLTENTAGNKDIMDFGEDAETEQLLQILHSNRIRDKIINKYDLMNHYQIDTNSSYRLTRLYREYENNINFKRTEFMAVRITVLDRDPQVAADIANEISQLLDSTKNDMQRQRAQRAYEIVKNQYYKLRNEVKQMEDSLTVLRSLGVHDYESQAEMINQQLAIELAGNNNQGVRRLEAKLETLAKYGGPYVSIRDALEHERKQLSMLRARYEEAKTDAEEVLPVKFVVNSAYKAERKSHPIRWLIVMVTTVSTLLFTIILLLIIENINTYFPGSLKISGGFFENIKRPDSAFSDDNTQKKKQAGSDETKMTGDQPLSNRPYPDNNPPVNQSALNKKSVGAESEDISQKETSKEQRIENKSQTIEKTENQMARYFTNTNIIKLHYKWRIHLLVIILLGAIVAAIFSSPLFITPKFKSYALVYPSNVDPYSDESESEQMLQFLQSADIRDQIIKMYDLPKRYKIDSSYKYYQTAMIGEYSKNVQLSKTPFETVKIEVMDADPYIARDMVNSIIRLYDEKVLRTHRAKYKEVVDFIRERLQQKQMEIDSVESQLYVLRTEYGIIDYPNQSREVARGFLRTVDGNNAAQNINTREVLKLKENIEKYGGLYTYLNNRYFELIAEYGKVKMDLDQAEMNYDKEITYSNVISNPYASDKKSYPVRWVIVALTALGIWFFSLITVLIIENFESIKKNF